MLNPFRCATRTTDSAKRLTPLLPAAAIGMPDAPELLILLLIVVIIFGPSRLPQLGKSLGSAINQFKTHVNKIDDPDEPGSVKNDAMPEEPAKKDTTTEAK